MVELPADSPAPPVHVAASQTLEVGCLSLLAGAAIALVVLPVVFMSHPPMEADYKLFGRTVKLADQLIDFFGTPLSAVVLLWLAGRLGPSRRDLLGLRPPSWLQVLFWIAVFGILSFGYPYVTHRTGLFPSPDCDLIRAYTSAPLLPIFWLTMVVIIPCWEELLCRGLLLGGLGRSRLGFGLALVLTALLFSVLREPHDSYVLACGLLFGAARLATGSTYLSMGLNCAYSFVATTRVAIYPYTHS